MYGYSLRELSKSGVRILQASLPKDRSHHLVLHFLFLLCHAPQLWSQGLAGYYLELLILVPLNLSRAAWQELLFQIHLEGFMSGGYTSTVGLRVRPSYLLKPLIHELILHAVVRSVVIVFVVKIRMWRRLDDHRRVFLSHCTLPFCVLRPQRTRTIQHLVLEDVPLVHDNLASRAPFLCVLVLIGALVNFQLVFVFLQIVYFEVLVELCWFRHLIEVHARVQS